MISGRTTLIAHIGYPTEAFKAPMIYNPFFEKAGIDAVVMRLLDGKPGRPADLAQAPAPGERARSRCHVPQLPGISDRAPDLIALTGIHSRRQSQPFSALTARGCLRHRLPEQHRCRKPQICARRNEFHQHGAATASGFSPRSTAAAPSTAAWMVSAIAPWVKPIRCGVSTVLGWSNTGWCAGGSGS